MITMWKNHHDINILLIIRTPLLITCKTLTLWLIQSCNQRKGILFKEPFLLKNSWKAKRQHQQWLTICLLIYMFWHLICLAIEFMSLVIHQKQWTRCNSCCQTLFRYYCRGRWKQWTQGSRAWDQGTMDPWAFWNFISTLQYSIQLIVLIGTSASSLACPIHFFPSQWDQTLKLEILSALKGECQNWHFLICDIHS